MAKKDMSKVITSGSPKQRIKLFIENFATRKYGGKEMLSEKETKALFDSFKSDYEIKLYNKWQRIDRAVTHSITNLQGLKFEVLMHYSNLRGYILVWHTIEEAEMLTNSILHELEEPERKQIAGEAIKKNKIMFSQLALDEEGYMDLRTDFEKVNPQSISSAKARGEEPKKTKAYSLAYVMNNVKRDVEASVIKFKTWRQATLDYMEEEGFSIKTYNNLIERMTEDVERPLIGWNKYLSSSDTFFRDEPTRLDKIKPHYNIVPDIYKLEINKEMYNTYVKEHLKE